MKSQYQVPRPTHLAVFHCERGHVLRIEILCFPSFPLDACLHLGEARYIKARGDLGLQE